MQLDIKEYPLGSKKRAIAQITGGDLNKGLKTAQTGNINLSSLSKEINSTIEQLFSSGNIGTILTAYYQYGNLSTISIDQLLQKMYDLKDYPSYLKQVYRFGKYNGIEEQIERCLKWHEERKLPDAYAWRLKIAKLIEQVKVSESSQNTEIKIIDEETSLQTNKNIYLELRPIKTELKEKDLSIVDELPDEKYIYSQISKNKLEKANQAHSQTLKILGLALQKRNCPIKETKLIDAYAIIGNKKIIFEIKSITEANEREQIRKAISQLYEYRFLYSLFDALLCIVFSQRPFSQWLIDYLITDRQIHVLWIENGEITGKSLGEII
jgi:hypothetical protein